MSAKYINTITDSSAPEYGYYGFGWLSSYWDQADWIKWHQLLVLAYGLDAANERFIIAWNDSPFLAANWSFRNSIFGENAEFIAYAKANGFHDALFSGILGTAMQVVSETVDTTKNVVSTVGNVSDSLKSVSKFVLPVALIGSSIILIFYLKKRKLI